jgi:glycosyltransferase involved in cell wall biosynthesis
VSRIIQLYPFSPDEWHGGTLRLKTAVDASSRLGSVEIYWWDECAGLWEGPLPIEEIGRARREHASAAASTASARIKRWLFPSTLWESGRQASSHASQLLGSLQLDADDLVVLHTTYLAPVVPVVTELGARVVVDVHDLVWRAHRMDADIPPVVLWPVRAAYSVAVRKRELSLLKEADGLLVCGWRDSELLGSIGSVGWTPTGVDAVPTTTAQTPGPMRIGLIGNFAHSATLDTAKRLVNSPLSRDPNRVQLVFAGRFSDKVPELATAGVVLGPVRHVQEFYDQVNAVVVPVRNGSGMKCKLAEAAIAGKPVLTTPAGASGYPPQLRRLFIVWDEAEELTPDTVIAAIRDAPDSRAMRTAFLDTIGVDAAASRYQKAIERCLSRPRAGSPVPEA